jgi:hypothetical protein
VSAKSAARSAIAPFCSAASARGAEPAASLRFGPDRRLYAAFDDGGEARQAGDAASPNGKILRLNATDDAGRSSRGVADLRRRLFVAGRPRLAAGDGRAVDGRCRAGRHHRQ